MAHIIFHSTIIPSVEVARDKGAKEFLHTSVGYQRNIFIQLLQNFFNNNRK